MCNKRLVLCLGGLLLSSCTPMSGPTDHTNGNSNSNANTNDNAGSDNDNVAAITPGVQREIANEGAAHIASDLQATYVANPPASGPHWSEVGLAPVAPGFYMQILEEEQWIHNLEHGYVVVLYDCKGPCEQSLIDQLSAFAENAAPSDVFAFAKIVITPYSGLPFLLTAVAWDVQLPLAEFDDVALTAFYTEHLDSGPELAP